MNPLVTISMPVYNCRATVADAIASLLNQALEDWELIVLDDGSCDGTADIVRKFADPRISLIEGDTNRGLSARLNQIASTCRSLYFARMDGDDVSYPNRLKHQVDFLCNHPEVDLVAGAMIIFGRDGRGLGVRRGPREHERICVNPYSGFPMAHSTWLGRTDWFRNNPYREDAVRMEDWDLLFRTHEVSKFANLQEVVMGYREASLSLRKLASTRWHKSRFVIEYAWIDGRFGSALGEVGKQAAKLLLDAFALGTGLNHRVLRHRVPQASRAELDAWREVLLAAQRTARTCREELKSVLA
jgi:glycosyltransferase involved in cell wall biosynthesis